MIDHTTQQILEILAPRLRPGFTSQTLTRSEIVKKCFEDGTFFEHYDRGESHTLDLPTTPGGYSTTELEEMIPLYTTRIHIDSPYVCELNDVDLTGPNAVAITSRGYIFESCLKMGNRLAKNCLYSMASGVPPIKSPLLQPNQTLGTVMSLVGPWTNNYTHWFQDYLTRLEGLTHYCSETGRDPMLLIPSDATQWMLDALEAVGWGPDKWIMWDGGRATVNHLVVSEIRQEDMDASKYPPHVKHNGRRRVYSPKGVKWVRNRIKQNITPERTCSHSKFIYLSRDGLSSRRVRNENEVMELLSDYGFKRYYPHRMSFAEQVTLFSNAKAIISPHGSGLMNQIFADDAIVIELMGKKQTVTTPATEYYYAELLGHDYACVPGEPANSDLRTDVSGIETILDDSQRIYRENR
jgi:hypothetical protein